MIEPTPIDVLPVLQAVEQLLRVAFAITFSVVICGGLAYVLCSVFGDGDGE